ncbi:MAG: MmcQ/YjbR family DNA-binding protein [Treponema sp.]|nr:MmcQ/YjbR family DNA-binding protein [Treponema sp.]
MDRPALLEFLAGQSAATSDMPFDDSALVFRIGGKIFAIVDVKAEGGSVSLKCEPEMSGDLRVAWPCIRPGWHLNKEHWNTIALDGTLPDEILEDLVRRSWELVASSLGRAAREKAGLAVRRQP